MDLVQAGCSRKVFKFDYEVEGKHFDGLAGAEQYAKELLHQYDYKDVIIYKDKKELEYWFWRQGRLDFQKIKNM